METSSSTGDDNAPPPPPMEPMVIDDHHDQQQQPSTSTSKAAGTSTKTSTDDSTVSEKSTSSSSKFPCCSSGLHLTTEQLLNLADFELVHAADIAAYFGEVAAQAQGQGPNGQGGENLREKECGICFDRVLEKRLPSKRRFGLLNKCAHVFCAGCLEEWRRRSKICPVCRVPSEKYVTTRRWTADEAAKAALFASALHFDFAAVGNLFAFRGGGGGGGARGRRVANEMAQLREEAGRLLNLPNAGGGGGAAAAADNVPLNWDRGLFADVLDGDGLDIGDIEDIDDSEDSEDDSDDDDDNLVLRLEELVEEGGNDDVHDQLFFHPSGRRLARLNRNFNQAVVEAEAADAAIRAAQAAAQLDQNIPDQNNRNFNQARNLPGPNPNAIVATGVDMSSSNSSQSSEEEEDDDDDVDNFGDDFDDDDDYESAHSEEEYDMAAMYDDLEGMFDDYEDVFGPGDGDDGDGEADPNRPTLEELVADAVVMARNGGPEGLDRLRARRGVGGGLGGGLGGVLDFEIIVEVDIEEVDKDQLLLIMLQLLWTKSLTGRRREEVEVNVVEVNEVNEEVNKVNEVTGAEEEEEVVEDTEVVDDFEELILSPSSPPFSSSPKYLLVNTLQPQQQRLYHPVFLHTH
ncbi:hypothetical protein TYRP_010492 [Tyrophagus putrescentiae]|nr:hypothetical protein TYRP_010492 [Tyrophagus putrescentiae]